MNSVPKDHYRADKVTTAWRPKRERQSVNAIYRYADLARVFKLRHNPTRLDDPEFGVFWVTVRGITTSVPPYLRFPSRLPVSGELISNGNRQYAFLVSSDPISRNLTFEGRRNAAEFEGFSSPISDERRSSAQLEEVLSALTDRSPKRHYISPEGSCSAVRNSHFVSWLYACCCFPLEGDGDGNFQAYLAVLPAQPL